MQIFEVGTSENKAEMSTTTLQHLWVMMQLPRYKAARNLNTVSVKKQIKQSYSMYLGHLVKIIKNAINACS